MRLDVVDIIKGISIIMIVNVHLISGLFFPCGGTFLVIAFFLTAGIVSGLKESWNEMSIGEFFMSRLVRLMYPYLTLSVCYICFHICLNIIRGDNLINGVIVDSTLKTVTLQGVGTLWFLPVLFLGEIIFFTAKRCKVPDSIIGLGGDNFCYSFILFE